MFVKECSVLDAIVKSVTDNSIACDIGVLPGDIVVSVNGTPIKDILDFRYLTASEQYEI
ncbi:MAG: TIGR03279 family radical SAM protein, partial [Clostridia bacterium]|nr:TIGR03279 family radical SAM protein [Clostridia bacterium]